MINYIQNRGSAVLKNRVIYRSFRTGVQIVSPSQKEKHAEKRAFLFWQMSLMCENLVLHTANMLDNYA